MRKRQKTKQLETKNRHKNLHTAICDAFKEVRRQLQDYVRLQRREVKTHKAEPHARVSRLVPAEEHGFISTIAGREIYFHRNSVLNGAFDRLQVGSEVKFTEEPGEKGPQVRTVKLIRTHRAPYTEKKTRRPVRAFH